MGDICVFFLQENKGKFWIIQGNQTEINVHMKIIPFTASELIHQSLGWTSGFLQLPELFWLFPVNCLKNGRRNHTVNTNSTHLIYSISIYFYILRVLLYLIIIIIIIKGKKNLAYTQNYFEDQNNSNVL